MTLEPLHLIKKKGRLWGGLFAAVLAILFLCLSLSGLDYGHHWDEWRLLDASLKIADHKILLPGWYNYPSVSFALTTVLTWAYLGIEYGREVLSGSITPDHLREIVTQIHSRDTAVANPLLFLVRGGFAIAALAAVPLVYASTTSVKELRPRPITGLLAASLLLSSFPFFYHARWIAPDAIQVPLMAALIWSAIAWRQNPSNGFPWLPTIITGLLIGTKYPAGLFLWVPVYLACQTGPAVNRAIQVTALAGLVFIITTPGMILDPLRFLRDLSYEASHYATDGHGAYSIAAGWDHLVAIASFLAFKLLTPWPLVSAGFLFLAVIGIWRSWRENRALIWMLLLPTTAFIAYMAMQSVMIVRNFLLVLPIILLFTALGVRQLEDWLDQSRLSNFESLPRLRTATIAGVCLILLSASGLDYAKRNASLSSSPQLSGQELSQYGDRLLLSPRVSHMLQENGHLKGRKLPCMDQADLMADMPQATPLLFLNSEIENAWALSDHPDKQTIRLANQIGSYRHIAGPNDIDLDYYPTWRGHDRLILADPAIGANVAIWMIGSACLWTDRQ